MSRVPSKSWQEFVKEYRGNMRAASSAYRRNNSRRSPKVPRSRSNIYLTDRTQGDQPLAVHVNGKIREWWGQRRRASIRSIARALTGIDCPPSRSPRPLQPSFRRQAVCTCSPDGRRHAPSYAQIRAYSTPKRASLAPPFSNSIRRARSRTLSMVVNCHTHSVKRARRTSSTCSKTISYASPSLVHRCLILRSSIRRCRIRTNGITVQIVYQPCLRSTNAV
jgi:hypothetical protein